MPWQVIITYKSNTGDSHMNNTNSKKKTAAQTDIDMLHGPLSGKLIRFALPIALCSMLQQLFNAADTSVVGHFADSNALAAVGTNGEIVAFLVTLSTGLSVGANVWIASFIGEKKREKIPAMLHTAISFAILSGLICTFLGIFLAEPVLRIIKTPTSVLEQAILYLRIYLIGYPFLMVYNFGSAVLRAKGDSRRPFLALTFSGIINLLLNLFFVILCRLGVSGVAIATDISTAFSAWLVLFWLNREQDEFHFSIKNLRLEKAQLLSILTVGIPAAVQGAVFCFANIFVQASVNSFGAVATAGSTIAMNFEYFTYYIVTAFGQTATTFSSQNFAAGNRKRCTLILKLCIAFSLIFVCILTYPIVIWKDGFSALFTSDQQVIQVAAVRIMCILLFQPICCLYEIPTGILRGTGHSTLPAGLTVIGICLLRIVWIFTVFQKFHTLEVLYMAFPISWVVTVLLIWGGVCKCSFQQKNKGEYRSESTGNRLSS